ncbi:MAG TPA: tail fiber protein [Polyangiales bacterium]
MDYFLGEIRLFPYQTIPRGWHECDGTLLAIQSNPALYALLGVHFGGNGTTNFALPDLRGRVPVGGTLNAIGQAAGQEGVALTMAQLPVHSHMVNAYNGVANMKTPLGCMPATATKAGGPTSAPPPNLYGPVQGTAKMDASVIGAGGGVAHENRQPSMALVYCISISNAIFPPHS